MLTPYFISQLYHGGASSCTEPLLQLLNFERCEMNPNQLLVRLSDGLHFIDCLLIGSYLLKDGHIVSNIVSTSLQQRYSRHDIVRLAQYYSKIDETRICRLRIVIRRLTEFKKDQSLIGDPVDISQCTKEQQYSRKETSNERPSRSPNRSPITVTTISRQDPSRMSQFAAPASNSARLHNETFPSQSYGRRNSQKPHQNVHSVSLSQVIKIEDDEPIRNKTKLQQTPTRSVIRPTNHVTNKVLRVKNVLEGEFGWFRGRLLRSKMTVKETKEGPMTVIYLGFVDDLNQILRVNLVGKTALKEEKALHFGKVYNIRGLEVVNSTVPVGGVMVGPSVRIRDKDYEFMEVQEGILTISYPKEYYYWEHEPFHSDPNSFVDIIGVIDEIEGKTSYNCSNIASSQVSSEARTREVVRLLVRNCRKSVRVSFWADQIHQLAAVKIGMRIIMQDVKKKKSIFFDFTYESSYMLLEASPELLARYGHLLPGEDDDKPRNIAQLTKYFQEHEVDSRVHQLTSLTIVKLTESTVTTSSRENVHDNGLEHSRSNEVQHTRTNGHDHLRGNGFGRPRNNGVQYLAPRPGIKGEQTGIRVSSVKRNEQEADETQTNHHSEANKNPSETKQSIESRSNIKSSNAAKSNSNLTQKHQNVPNLTYMLCQNCKRRIPTGDSQCPYCEGGQSSYKYNFIVTFQDETGELKAIVYDHAGTKLLGLYSKESLFVL